MPDDAQRSEAMPEVNGIRFQPDAYYTEPAVAQMLGVSVDTMRRNRRIRSDIVFCRYGRRVFYRGADIAALLDRSRKE